MTALDMAMLLLTGSMAVMGYLRGFVQEVLLLLAWVVAVVAVRLFLAPVTDLATLWVGSPTAAGVLAFAGLFVLTFLLGKMLARRVGRSTRGSMIGFFDRVLGVGFGALKGLIIGTLVFLAFTLLYNMVFGLDAPRPGWMIHSRSYPLLQASGDAMRQFAHRQVSAADDADNGLDAGGNGDGVGDVGDAGNEGGSDGE